MAIQATPYLTFNGNCREAMNFYKECFGGELTLQTIGESPMAEQCPTGMEHQILHSSLENNGFLLMATDMLGPAGFIAGTDMAVSLNFGSEEEIKGCFEKLSSGGTVVDPLRDAPWNAIFGVTVDKFGKVWMFNYNKNGQ